MSVSPVASSDKIQTALTNLGVPNGFIAYDTVPLLQQLVIALGNVTSGGGGGGGGSGDVVGPASATDNAIARFNLTTGKLIQNSGITIADGASGTLAGSNSGDVTLSGTPDYITISGQTITRGLIDLATDVTGALPIANGGTGQTSQTNAFDALAPTTTKGDLIAHNGTDNVRLAVGGTNGQVLSVDSTAATGVKWATAPGADTAPTSITYAATVTPVFTDGQNREITMTGDLTLNGPTGGSNGSTWQIRLIASGAIRTITLGSNIVTPTGTTFSGAVASGSTRLLQMIYNGSKWWVVRNQEFTA